MDTLKSSVLALVVLFSFSASAQEVQLDGAWLGAIGVGNHNYLALKLRGLWFIDHEEGFFFINPGYMFGDKKLQGAVSVGSFHTTHNEHALALSFSVTLNEFVRKLYLYAGVDVRFYDVNPIDYEVNGELEALWVANEDVSIGFVAENLSRNLQVHESPFGLMVRFAKLGAFVAYEPIHRTVWFRFIVHLHTGGPH